jgi:hypothetical protein
MTFKAFTCYQCLLATGREEKLESGRVHFLRVNDNHYVCIFEGVLCLAWTGDGLTEIRSIFAQHGVAPRGQSLVVHQVHPTDRHILCFMSCSMGCSRPFLNLHL